jgi:hypothetical protein
MTPSHYGLFVYIEFEEGMGAKIMNQNIKRSNMLHFAVNTGELNAVRLLAGRWGINVSEALRRCVIETAQAYGLDGVPLVTRPATSDSEVDQE